MKNKTDFLLLFAAGCTVAALIAFSREAKAGAAQGLDLALNTVAPSLLPLLTVFAALENARAYARICRLLAKPTWALFRLPACCGGVILFGLAGGYPTGAVLCRALYEEKKITAAEAARLMEFNVCGGAAFILTAVGTVLLQNKNAGWILYASCVLGALGIGALRARFAPKGKRPQDGAAAGGLDAADAVCKGAEQALGAVLHMCAFMALFCALIEVCRLPDALAPVFEITSGLFGNKAFSMEFYAAFLAFGGFCVHLQILPHLNTFHMPYGRFLLFRTVHALLAFGICKALLAAFPQTQTVFSSTAETTAEPFAGSALLFALMLFGACVFVAELRQKKERC